MIKHSYKKYFSLLAGFLLLFSIPKSYLESAKAYAVGILTPTLATIAQNSFNQNANIELQKLQIQIQKLQAENKVLTQVVDQEKFLNRFCRKLNNGLELNERHHAILTHCLAQQMHAIPASIVFRSPYFWESTLWLNVGKDSNVSIGKDIITKNSPVVVGNHIIGVVDYVGSRQSRVRLITDSGLTPSVRVMRGGRLFDASADSLALIIDNVLHSADLKEKEEILTHLRTAKNILVQNQNKSTEFLAKGELKGSSKPLWRHRKQVLSGTGFNYDFDDEEGPAQELNSVMPLIKIGDLLTTTGFDGVFPEGFHVAYVTKVFPLKEGDFYYEIEATPSAGNLDDLHTVFVLPPVVDSLTEEESNA